MAETLVEEDRRALTPANENPWYVLMTLYGEQVGEHVDWALHAKNRAAWNAWACQGMSDEKLRAVAASSRVSIEELTAWPTLQKEVALKHKVEMERRNDGLFQYSGMPDLKRSILLEEIEIKHLAILDGMIFPRSLRLGKTCFERFAQFGYVTFLGNAYFGSTVFLSEAIFAFAHFEQEAWFFEAKFHTEAEFSVTKFHGFTYFIKAQFSMDGKKHQASFMDCEFHKSTNFGEAIFHHRYPTFAGAVMHDKTNFTDNAKNWPKSLQSNPIQAKAACAVIRHSLGKQGLPEAEHFFFRREMGFAAQIGGWWQRSPYRLFGLFSDYGYSIQRPAISLFWVWFLPAMIFAGFRVTGTVATDVFEVLWAAALSFANLFPIFGFHRVWFDADKLAALNPWLKALAGGQTVVSLPLLFFLGLGLRTRFRMR